MKRFVAGMSLAVATMVLLNGCVVALGNKDLGKPKATLGEELVDLKRAKETGAITEAEYEVQKAKLLEKSK